MPLTEEEIRAVQEFIAADGRPRAAFWGMDPDDENHFGLTITVHGRKIGIIRTQGEHGVTYTAEPIATDDAERDRVTIDMTGVPIPDYPTLSVA